MNIQTVKLLFDFGLVVLIWLVQLIVYPSFSYYQQNNLIRWHKEYTFKLGYIVMPLMIGQLTFSIIDILKEFTVLKAIGLVLILAVWLSTFLQFIPLHHKISSNISNDMVLKQLVLRNWLRTLLWTLVFILSYLVMD